ncbi:MAG TPA: hypothetical protein VJP80_06090 [Candidatus Saccharimonadales bacterium]|nr:hypothetical protein [Candidatus Saccharimonadales bacterium]
MDSSGKARALKQSDRLQWTDDQAREQRQILADQGKLRKNDGAPDDFHRPPQPLFGALVWAGIIAAFNFLVIVVVCAVSVVTTSIPLQFLSLATATLVVFTLLAYSTFGLQVTVMRRVSGLGNYRLGKKPYATPLYGQYYTCF